MKRAVLGLTLLLAACTPASVTPEQAAPAATLPPTAVVATPPDSTQQVAPTLVEPGADAPVPPAALVPTEQPTTVPVPPTVSEPPTATVAASAVISGRTPEGAFFYGAPDAPLALIDYSDFL